MTAANLEITELGYLGFEVSDLAAWRHMATGIMGLMIGDERADGSFALRNDQRQGRFYVRPGDADDLCFVGLATGSQSDMDAVADRVRASGIEVTSATDQELAERGVAGMVHFQEPAGMRIEVFHGDVDAETPFESKLVVDGFKTDGLGLGHFVLRANDLEESLEFFLNVLGFRLSDRIIADLGGYHVNIAFTHCNERHHSVAFGENLPKRIHHFMLEVNNIDDVGACWDRVVDAGLTVWNAIGRHPNDRMISFYAETPSGFQFEYGWGGREVDDETWETTVYDRISDWGHEHPGVMFKKLFRKQKKDDQ